MKVLQMLDTMWRYRGFVIGSVKRDYHQRYRRSALGALWTVLQPLATVLIYALVFSQLMRIRLPELDDTFSYSIYICTGIIVWNFFAATTTRCVTVFVDNADMLKKLSFPRLCLPLTVLLSTLLDFAIISCIFLGFLLIIGRMPGLELLALALPMAWLIMFSVSLGVLLGVLNVFFRDIGQAFNMLLQFWFWLTPIVYPLAIVPERFAQALAWNPMTGVLGAFQTVMVRHEMFPLTDLLGVALTTLVTMALAWWIVRRSADDMVDEL